MSLINDALKRARQQAPPETPPSAAEDPAMTPATHAPHSPQWPLVAVPLLLVGVVGVAAWFFWAASSSMGLSARALTGATVAAREELPSESSPPPPPPLPASKPAAVAASPGAAAVAASASVPPVVTNAAPAPAVPVVPVPKPAAATLKLQAIFYRLSHPTAIISSKTVSRGDTVLGARVLRIDRESVALWVNGQTNVLTLP